MSKQAILYIRVSTTTQIDGGGLDRQHNGALSYIAEMGWNLEATISDAGRSAFHAANRAPGSALHKFEMEALKGLHQGKVLVVENLDRLSRQGPKALTRLIFMLNDSGVDVAVSQNRKVFAADIGNDSADDNEVMLNLFEGIFVGYRGKEESVTKSNRGKLLWVNRSRLESLLHRFFDPVRADIEIKDRFGKAVRPREWFFATPDHVTEVVRHPCA